MSCLGFLKCENPGHKENIKNFLRKYPTAKGRVPDAIIVVDPKYWHISDNPKDNTARWQYKRRASSRDRESQVLIPMNTYRVYAYGFTKR